MTQNKRPMCSFCVGFTFRRRCSRIGAVAISKLVPVAEAGSYATNRSWYYFSHGVMQPKIHSEACISLLSEELVLEIWPWFV